MNYFEIFGIPVQLKLDKETLRDRFFELSRQYHPDYFVSRTQVEQALALERSSLLNKAWRTFQDPPEIIKYVLKLKGLLAEEEKYELPAEFLMEMLEINEQLMDAGDGTRDAEMEQKVARLENEIYEPVKEIIENYKDGITTEKELLQVKEYYFKKKYLERIKNQLKGMS